ncbi:unnamed protein product [Mesocestoides corti]|uniref:DUF7041 domain-containing protein n=2 Tax=Mesocestoides corti TaxID=53468 RepID=A0A0R3UPN3_MESCO|nr:unnamed protein product [Mesocestoides corti]
MYVGSYSNFNSVMNVGKPEIWFLQLEARFYLQGITSQLDKYYIALTELPDSAAVEVVDLLETVPEENPYDQLKQTVITRLTEVHKAHIRNQLKFFRLANMQPSELLTRMREVVKDSIDEAELCQTWTKCLPKETRRIIEDFGKGRPLDKLAEMADLVHADLAAAAKYQIPQLGGAIETNALSFAVAEIGKLTETLNMFLKRLKRAQLK